MSATANTDKQQPQRERVTAVGSTHADQEAT
jgi:hypothetical protein